MKSLKFFSVLLLLSLFVSNPSSIAASPATTAVNAAGPVIGLLEPSDIGEWQTGPFPPNDFQYARHDGAFVPGPALEPWANKVYFPGGRTSPSTESSIIWMYDPVTGTYTDTGEDVVEDVSNYNANLILDDGTGRGPAIYVIGGTDKDHGGTTIGTVQRYYPKTNEAESLPTADDWNGKVGGYRVAAVGTAVVDDIIYVYGGWETSVSPYFSSETWAFDPKQPSGSRWTNLGVPLSTARSYIMSAVQDGKIYAIGGVGSYVGGELDPVDTFEVLDTANLAAGWTLLAPMPAPGGEGRAFGFDSDTLRVNSPYQGKLYVVAPNDWPSVSSEVLEYDVATNTWLNDLPELPTPRADLAGTFIPLCTADADDGLPGIWTFGGRVNESCDPPLGPVEYAPMTCESVCIPLTGVEIAGPEQLIAGETGIYTATILPEDATAPVFLSWSNGQTTPEAGFTWDWSGSYTVVITATNCDSGSVVTDTLDVTVTDLPISGLLAANDSPTMLGETTTLTASVESGTSVVYTWDLGDETSAEGAVVEHVYPAGGDYTAVVTATNSLGSEVATTTVTIDTPGIGLGAINDSPTVLGLTTTLTATAESGAGVEYAWDLGDSTYAEGAVVSHIYPAVGVYTAVVTATNELGSEVATTIVLIEEPISGLAATNDSPTLLGLTTTLTAAVQAGSNVVYTWDMGDGTLAEGAVVEHIYPAVGVYTAVVTATNSLGSQSTTTSVVIEQPITTFYDYLPLVVRSQAIAALGQPSEPVALLYRYVPTWE